jgi:hypothetical protein
MIFHCIVIESISAALIYSLLFKSYRDNMRWFSNLEAIHAMDGTDLIFEFKVAQNQEFEWVQRIQFRDRRRSQKTKGLSRDQPSIIYSIGICEMTC